MGIFDNMFGNQQQPNFTMGQQPNFTMGQQPPLGGMNIPPYQQPQQAPPQQSSMFEVEIPMMGSKEKQKIVVMPLVMALNEVVKWLKMLKMCSIAGFVGIFVGLFGYAMNPMVGMALAFIASMFMVFFIYKSNVELKRLLFKYGVK